MVFNVFHLNWINSIKIFFNSSIFYFDTWKGSKPFFKVQTKQLLTSEQLLFWHQKVLSNSILNYHFMNWFVVFWVFHGNWFIWIIRKNFYYICLFKKARVRFVASWNSSHHLWYNFLDIPKRLLSNGLMLPHSTQNGLFPYSIKDFLFLSLAKVTF